METLNPAADVAASMVTPSVCWRKLKLKANVESIL
jgi:hypothetical protein